jgi:hypothetical protein
MPEFERSCRPILVRQADRAISQVNPVSNAVYNVLPLTINARIHSLAARIDFAAGQPTDLRIRVTLDGNVLTYTIAAPGNTTPYTPIRGSGPDIYDETAQLMAAGFGAATPPFYEWEGHAVQVDALITWAVNQPTPLICRVKWSRKL